jgi:hypothetical protein
MVDVGDYVVRNDQGEFSRCASNVFDSTYETALAEVTDITPKILDLAAIKSSINL